MLIIHYITQVNIFIIKLVVLVVKMACQTLLGYLILKSFFFSSNYMISSNFFYLITILNICTQLYNSNYMVSSIPIE